MAENCHKFKTIKKEIINNQFVKAYIKHVNSFIPWLKEARGKTLRRNMGSSTIVSLEAAVLNDKCC